jgi:large subunit ribosomal protein L25
MEITKIDASPRHETGKTKAAQLRRQGQIPAVAYGKGLKTTTLAISPKSLLGTLKSSHGKNSVIELAITGGEKLTVLVHDYSYHPVNRELTHVDFIQIKLDQLVDVEVPLVTFGKAVGITTGGTLRIVYRMLPIRCLPEQIPVKIEHDITPVGLNESVKVSQLTLPAGVKVRLPDDQTVAAIVAPEKERAEDAAAATPAAGAAAAPAAGAAAAKPAAGAAAAKKDEKAPAKKK